MTILGDDIAAYVEQALDKRLRSLQTAVGTVITSPSQTSTDILTVTLDGSALAVPVKGLRGFPVFPGARVALIKFGSDWTLVGGFTNPGAGTGTSRMIIGADTPPELQAYGIDVAILTYITDKTTHLEVGYFFIGSSNRFDGNGDNRVQAFGNVVYPTPGDPSSAVMASVKTNFQQNMYVPYPQTMFKDQAATFWANILLDPGGGMQAFQIAGPGGNRDVHFVIGENTAEASGSTSAALAATLIAGTLITLGNNSITDYAEVTACADMTQSVAGGNTAVVELVVNGTAVSRQIIFSGQTAGARATCTQQWRVPLTAVNASNTFQLRIQAAGGAVNTIAAGATHTNLHVKIVQVI